MKMKLRHSLALLIFGGLTVGPASAQQYDQLDLSNQPLANKLCVTCHGGDGAGNPAVGGPALGGIEPWYLRNQLLSFRNNYRGRQPEYIPAFEMQDSVAELSDEEIEDVVATISAWPAVDNPPSISGNASRGSELYVSCAACHGVNGGGNEALSAPGLTAKDDWYLVRQLKLFKSGFRGGHPDDQWGAQMMASVGMLESDQDINDVVAYINSLN